MKKYIKISIAIIFCFLCTVSIAANRFIIKYKSNDNNTNISTTNYSVKKIPAEKIIILSRKAEQAGDKTNKIIRSYVLATGAFVIILDKDLDKNQTENFINSVKEDNDVKYIEEDKVMKMARSKQK